MPFLAAESPFLVSGFCRADRSSSTDPVRRRYEIILAGMSLVPT